MVGRRENGSLAVSTLFEIVRPSYLLFPALLGTMIMGLVCPLIGSYLVLRRTVFLGLTLPQIAAAGVSFTFWLQQSGFLPQWEQSERGMGMFGSLLFTFLGMGILGYLEQRGKGFPEGRLAAAYAFAGGLTILFIVFNPAGQIEVLSHRLLHRTADRHGGRRFDCLGGFVATRHQGQAQEQTWPQLEA